MLNSGEKWVNCMQPNLFEKFYNYRLQQALADSSVKRTDQKDKYKREISYPAVVGPFPITDAERSWLKTMLRDNNPSSFLEQKTVDKLNELLGSDSELDLSGLVNRQTSRPQVPNEHIFNSLRYTVHRQQGICLTYRLNDGTVCNSVPGYPYRLEYSMTRREWYLIWLLLAEQTVLTTPIRAVWEVTTGDALPPDEISVFEAQIISHLKKRQQQAVIEVNTQYIDDLHRVFYVFSCFEREIVFDEVSQRYQLRVIYFEDERMYLLSKIRFLGKRVRLLEPTDLVQSMRKTIEKALRRYEKGSI